ncbi:MAG TPA: hypothetical protein PKK69_05735, partial [Ferruginibacter sp.]|nr:hypothetical protein [Ferruginibacter sp.]
KKGTARLSLSSWENKIPLRVLPAGINYHSYQRFGKHVRLSFGHPIEADHINRINGYGKSIHDFNARLRSELEPLVLHCHASDDVCKSNYLVKPVPAWRKKILLFPAALGYLLHAPLYAPLQRLTHRKAQGTGHYDSILVGLLFLTYPFYLFLWGLLLLVLTGVSAWILLPLLFPFLAYAFIQWKEPFPGKQ